MSINTPRLPEARFVNPETPGTGFLSRLIKWARNAVAAVGVVGALGACELPSVGDNDRLSPDASGEIDPNNTHSDRPGRPCVDLTDTPHSGAGPIPGKPGGELLTGDAEPCLPKDFMQDASVPETDGGMPDAQLPDCNGKGEMNEETGECECDGGFDPTTGCTACLPERENNAPDSCPEDITPPPIPIITDGGGGIDGPETTFTGTVNSGDTRWVNHKVNDGEYVHLDPEGYPSDPLDSDRWEKRVDSPEQLFDVHTHCFQAEDAAGNLSGEVCQPVQRVPDSQ